MLDQSFQASKDFTTSVASHTRTIDEAHELSSSKLESILENMVSYRDVPAMKDLLLTQKKIRSLLDDWLNYCRTSLNIMAPSMYILPELKLIRDTNDRVKKRNRKSSPPLTERKKSHSAELMRRTRLGDFDLSPIDLQTSSSPMRDPASNSILKLPDLIVERFNDRIQRSKSAFIGKLTRINRWIKFLCDQKI